MLTTTITGHQDVQDYIARFGKRKVEAEALVVRPRSRSRSLPAGHPAIHRSRRN